MPILIVLCHWIILEMLPLCLFFFISPIFSTSQNFICPAKLSSPVHPDVKTSITTPGCISAPSLELPLQLFSVHTVSTFHMLPYVHMYTFCLPHLISISRRTYLIIYLFITPYTLIYLIYCIIHSDNTNINSIYALTLRNLQLGRAINNFW